MLLENIIIRITMNKIDNKNLSLDALPKPKIYENVSAEEFKETIFTQYERPVLRGLASDWELVKSANISQQSVLDYLREFSSDKKLPLVTLPQSTKGRLFYKEDMSGLNFSSTPMTFSDSLAKMDSRLSKQDKYCVQCVRVDEAFNGLSEQLNNPLLNKTNRPFIWFGNDVSVAPHFDEAHNIAVVAAGKRRFTLFPPEQIKNLYIGTLDFTPAGQPISMVDVNNPDLNLFPLYEKAYKAGFSVELNPGDAIYIPTPWWHQVNSLSEFNVLINYWWSDNYVSSALPFPMLMHAIQALKNRPTAEKKAWENILHYYLFDEGHDPAAHIPPHAKGLLGEITPKMAANLHRWLAQNIQ